MKRKDQPLVFSKLLKKINNGLTHDELEHLLRERVPPKALCILPKPQDYVDLDESSRSEFDDMRIVTKQDERPSTAFIELSDSPPLRMKPASQVNQTSMSQIIPTITGRPSAILEAVSLAHLDLCFPPAGARGEYRASEWQLAVLSGMDRVRREKGHCIGGVVMATAAGKTVLSILDIENQV